MRMSTPDVLNEFSFQLRELIVTRLALAKALIGIGACWSIYQTLSIFRFATLYLPQKSPLKKYIEISDGNPATWALVTGASDGIGKGFAEELCSRGVNVVLHGRNEQKLHKVSQELLEKWPATQVKILVLDAEAGATEAAKLEDARATLESLNLRILINNVGGTPTPLWAPLVDRTMSDIGLLLNVNARFPTEMTRVLLPTLMQSQPSLIINIGSGSSDFASPYVEVLSGAKAYTQAWSRSLRLEMQAEGQDVEVLHYQVGMVQSGNTSAHRSTNFLIPSSRYFAKCGLDVVGCQREVVWPYWPHAMQFGLIGLLPQFLRNKAVLSIALKEKALESGVEKAS